MGHLNPLKWILGPSLVLKIGVTLYKLILFCAHDTQVSVSLSMRVFLTYEFGEPQILILLSTWTPYFFGRIDKCIVVVIFT